MSEGMRSRAALTCARPKRVRPIAPEQAVPIAPPAGPVDFDAALDQVARTHGSPAVVDLLLAALTDPKVDSDVQIDRYLDRLKSACRQTRRYRAAVPVFKRIAVLNPARRHEMAAELAIVHAHLGEHAAGLAMLASAVAGQRRLSAPRRSLAFCIVAELAARVLRDATLAQEVLAMGRTAGVPAQRAARPAARPVTRPTARPAAHPAPLPPRRPVEQLALVSEAEVADLDARVAYRSLMRVPAA